MKNIFVFCFVLLGFGDMYAQDTISKTQKRSRFVLPNPSASDTSGDNPVFIIVNKQPKFPGDIDTYLSDHVQYPEEAKQLNIQGTVYVSFIVEKDGSVSGVKVLRGVNHYLDDEAIRVVTELPKWTPGMQNGHLVRVQYMIPLRFILNGAGLPITEPRFPFELRTWIFKQSEYPEDALNKKIEGNVYVRFTVEEDGKVSKIKVVKGVKNGKELDKEAERIVSIMPKWTPAYQDSKPVRTELTVIIVFRLKDDSIAKSIPVRIDSNLVEKPHFREDLDDWFRTHLIYPPSEKRNDHQGIVNISFIVEEDGSVTHIKIINSDTGYRTLENEALRVAYLMPRWIPGYENGIAVRTLMHYSIHFSLN